VLEEIDNYKAALAQMDGENVKRDLEKLAHENKRLLIQRTELLQAYRKQ